ncbi:MAG: type VI secretion system baseplate subunit TssE [Rhodoferax sp.]|nr:type VI secretion system baseplate subunit TssE [Rhodoferax sp.]
MSNTAHPLGHPGARPLPSSQERLTKKGEQRYLPTLFDRLCDDAPSESSEAPEAYASSRSQMRQIIQRDLSLLLNTTDQSDLIDRKRYPAAADSTINYGVPALAGGYLSEKKWIDIETMIRKAITCFEPRLVPETLVVRPLIKEQASANYNVLTFEISGLIHMEPYPLEFTVQSAVDLENSRIQLHNTRS